MGKHTTNSSSASISSSKRSLSRQSSASSSLAERVGDRVAGDSPPLRQDVALQPPNIHIHVCILILCQVHRDCLTLTPSPSQGPCLAVSGSGLSYTSSIINYRCYPSCICIYTCICIYFYARFSSNLSCSSIGSR
ncbi:hypothetical protein NW765_002949 [Fusarium oxysporum]|nr:hypothetical protein NW765_002949 [Fusarium oxysporum]